MKRLDSWAASAVFVAATVCGAVAIADEPSNTPYIDSIRKELPPAPVEESGSYSDRIRSQLPTEAPPQGSYIEQLKQQNPEKFAPSIPPSQGYSAEELKKLESKPAGGAIQALHEGRSELKPRYDGKITGAFGVRYAVTPTRNFSGTAEAVARSFDQLYGENYVPDLTLFYEFQPFYNEGFGTLNVLGSIGAAYFHGNGRFAVNLAKPAAVGTGNFGEESRTRFQFFEFPVSIGAVFRFNAARYLRPYVSAAPTLVVFNESRSDDGDSLWGTSKGIYTAVGASFLLDWISRSYSWDNYAENRVRHSYLTVEYGRLTPIASDVTFEASGFYAGFTFEY